MRDPLEQPEEAIRRVYAYVAYRIGAGPDAEDVTSATIERAIRYRGSYRKDDGSPAAWLIGIARRCIADHFATGSAISRSGRKPNSPGRTTRAKRPSDRPPTRRRWSRHPLARPCALRYGADLSSKEIGSMYDMSAGQSTSPYTGC